jgi:hypothetical protein
MLLSSLPCSIFPNEPGRGLKPRRRQCDRTIHFHRAKGLHCADAVPYGLTAATAHWSLSCGAAFFPCSWPVLLNADGGGGSLPYHSSAVDAICRRQPPIPRFLAALGPLSS